MARFDRFDICFAHQALENDWNKDGWLHERPSNQRRREATSIQLSRIGFSSPYQGGNFAALSQDDELENAAQIYVEKLVDFGLAKWVDPNDELGRYIRAEYTPEYLRAHFPQLIKDHPMKNRIELHLCEDCMLHEEIPEPDPDTTPERDAEICSYWRALKDQGQVFNDTHDPSLTRRECRNCGHIGDDEEFKEEVVDGDDVQLCPKCDSDDTRERDDGRNEFSWRRCDCCGSDLGGARYRYALFPKE